MDEVQDVDRSQLRLALLLAAPANRIFLVGDDDQTIYGWRLADVRRVLGLAADLPGLRRVDLDVNYRCPAPVVARAVRLVEHNDERFAKTIRPGRPRRGRLVLAPDAGRDATRCRGSWRLAGGRHEPRASWPGRERELLPAVAACLAGGIPFRARRACSCRSRTARGRAGRGGGGVAVARCRSRRASSRRHAPGAAPPTPDARRPAEDPDPEPAWTDAEIAAAVTGWAVRIAPDEDLATAIAERPGPPGRAASRRRER